MPNEPDPDIVEFPANAVIALAAAARLTLHPTRRGRLDHITVGHRLDGDLATSTAPAPEKDVAAYAKEIEVYEVNRKSCLNLRRDGSDKTSVHFHPDLLGTSGA